MQEHALKKYGWVSVVVSEGLLYPDGTPVSAAESKDKFNNTEVRVPWAEPVWPLNVHRIPYRCPGRGKRGVSDLRIFDYERL